MVYKRLQSFCRSRLHSLRSNVSRRQFYLNTVKKSLAVSHLRHHSDLHLFDNSSTIDSLEQIMPSPSESVDSMKSFSSKSHQQLTYKSSEDKASNDVLVVAPASTIPEVPPREASPTQRLLRSTLSKLRIADIDGRSPSDKGEGKKSQEENMSVSFDRMPNSQHHRMETVEETLILPDVGCRSLSDSCLHPTFECTNLNTVSDSRRSFLHKPRLHVDSSLMNEVDVLAAIKAGRVKTVSTETMPRTEIPEVDEFGLPVVSEVLPPNEHDGNPLIDSVEASPVSTPPISRCNSAAWSESYNGSDSWEDLRTESQVMNSVNQTIRHEAANVQRMQAPVVQVTPSTELPTPPTIDYRPESDENVWRTLRDQARATLPPQSPTPPHGRTIETLVPTNWPPRHGLNFRIEKPQKLSHLGSSSSSDFEDLLDNSLSSYLQHSVSYLGDSGPRLVDR